MIINIIKNIEIVKNIKIYKIFYNSFWDYKYKDKKDIK